MCCVPGTLARSPLGRSRRCLVPSRFLERRESRDREDRVPCLCSIPGRHKPSCATSCHLLWLPAMSLLTSLRCMQRRERGQQRWRTRRRRKSRWACGIAAAAHVAALIHGPIAFDEREVRPASQPMLFGANGSYAAPALPASGEGKSGVSLNVHQPMMNCRAVLNLRPRPGYFDVLHRLWEPCRVARRLFARARCACAVTRHVCVHVCVYHWREEAAPGGFHAACADRSKKKERRLLHCDLLRAARRSAPSSHESRDALTWRLGCRGLADTPQYSGRRKPWKIALTPDQVTVMKCFGYECCCTLYVVRIFAACKNPPCSCTQLCMHAAALERPVHRSNGAVRTHAAVRHMLCHPVLLRVCVLVFDRRSFFSKCDGPVSASELARARERERARARERERARAREREMTHRTARLYDT